MNKFVLLFAVAAIATAIVGCQKDGDLIPPPDPIAGEVPTPEPTPVRVSTYSVASSDSTGKTYVNVSIDNEIDENELNSQTKK